MQSKFSSLTNRIKLILQSSIYSAGLVLRFKGLGIVHLSKKDLITELVRKKQQMCLEQLRKDPELNHLDNDTIKKVLKNKLPVVKYALNYC